MAITFLFALVKVALTSKQRREFLRSLSEASTCLAPVKNKWLKLHTGPFSAELQAGKL